MKQAGLLFGLTIALTGCQHSGAIGYTVTAEDWDKVDNGVFCEYSWRSSGHAEPGIYPGPVLAHANDKLGEKIQATTKGSSSEAFIAPTSHGISTRYLTAKRLSPKQRKEMDDYLNTILQEAGQEAETYRKRKQADTAAIAQPPTPGS